MIMHDPFRDQPPAVWTKVAAAAAAAAPAERATNMPLRDPRKENRVTHLGYLPKQRRAAMREVAVENRRDDAIDAGGVTVEAKSLYLVRVGEPDGDVRLGLGYVSSLNTVGASEVKTQKVLWFVRKSKTATWGRTVQFKPCTSGKGRRLSDKINLDAFVLKVDVSDLTSASRRKRRNEPCLNMACVQNAKAIDEMLRQRDAAAEENTDEEVDSNAKIVVDPNLFSLKAGDAVYAEDEYKDWAPARVKEVKVDNGVLSACHVHYDGWSAKFDAWIEVNSGRISLRMPIFSDDEEDADEDEDGKDGDEDEDEGDEDDDEVEEDSSDEGKANPRRANAKAPKSRDVEEDSSDEGKANPRRAKAKPPKANSKANSRRAKATKAVEEDSSMDEN